MTNRQDYSKYLEALALYNGLIRGCLGGNTAKIGNVAKWSFLEAVVPDRIIKNKDATVFFWKDGTKTIVKKAEEDKEDPMTAYHFAVLKYLTGSAKQALDYDERVRTEVLEKYAVAKEKDKAREEREKAKAEKKKDLQAKEKDQE